MLALILVKCDADFLLSNLCFSLRIPPSSAGLSSLLFETYADKALQALQSVATAPEVRVTVMLFLEALILARPRVRFALPPLSFGTDSFALVRTSS